MPGRRVDVRAGLGDQWPIWFVSPEREPAGVDEAQLVVGDERRELVAGHGGVGAVEAAHRHDGVAGDDRPAVRSLGTATSQRSLICCLRSQSNSADVEPAPGPMPPGIGEA